MAEQLSVPLSANTRVSTGITGLDQILAGGLLAGGIYAITGEPGAGKTILGNQLCFAHVRAGGRVVYITLLSESYTRMFTHLQSLSFFDHGPVNDTLYYFSAYQVFDREGLSGLLTYLREVIREKQATLLVIDGLGSVEVSGATATEHLAFKRFVNHLQVIGELYRCTTLLLMNLPNDPAGLNRTMVDGVISLQMRLIELRMVRELHVSKFRGSTYLEGSHFYEITPQGIMVYPRLEAALTQYKRVPATSSERLSTGIAELDVMLRGGLRRGSMTMLLGPSGAGKTLSGLHFLQTGALAGEQGLWFGFYETEPELVEKAGQIGLDLEGSLNAGLISTIWYPPLEHLLDALAIHLLDELQRRNVRRLMINGFEAFKAASVYPERMGRFMAALANELRARQITTVFSFELRDLINPIVSLDVQGVSALVDNMIFLRQVEQGSQLVRMVSIMKTRSSDFDPTIRSFVISDHGIKVGPPSASLMGALAASAQSSSDGATDGGQVDSHHDDDPGNR